MCEIGDDDRESLSGLRIPLRGSDVFNLVWLCCGGIDCVVDIDLSIVWDVSLFVAIVGSDPCDPLRLDLKGIFKAL